MATIWIESKTICKKVNNCVYVHKKVQFLQLRHMPEKQTHTMTGSSLSVHVLWQSASGCSKPACLLLLHITTDPSVHWATWPDSSDQTPTVFLRMPGLSLRDIALSQQIQCMHEQQPKHILSSTAGNIRPSSVKKHISQWVKTLLEMNSCAKSVVS